MIKIKAIFYFVFLLTGLSVIGKAQPTTAYNFTMTDCNGSMHDLFTELDSGNVVILELFMLSCSPCVDAGKELDPMFQNLKATCSPKIKFYHMGYTNSYTCAQITNWVTTNGFSSVPFDSGAVQTAYYGGMGMPTMAIVAGSSHKVLHTTVGYTAGDTAVIADSIRAFFGCASMNVQESSFTRNIFIYPNPSNGKFTLNTTEYPIQLKVYNTMGEKVLETTVNNKQETVNLAGTDGVYFLQGNVKGETFSRKIILRKL